MREVTEVTGGRELDEALARLPKEVAVNLVVPLFAGQARLVKRAIEARLRATFASRSGRLARAIQVQVQISSRPGGGVVARWRIGLGRVGPEGIPFYGRFLHEGWRHIGRSRKLSRLVRRIRKGGLEIAGGTKLGKLIPGKPFMRSTFQSLEGTILHSIVQGLQTGIPAAAARVRKTPRSTN